MPNLTLSEKVVIKKGEDIALENSYDLAVIDDNKFKYYPEGSIPKKNKWYSFKRNKITDVYAVSNDERHKTNIVKPISHADGIHDFTVNIYIRFAVLDPETIIRTLRRDPVKCLRDEATRVIVRFLREENWSDLKDPQKFLTLKKNVLESYVSSGRNDSEAIFDIIQEHAKEYGLRPIEIDFNIKLPEKELEVEISTEQISNEKQIREAQIKKDIHLDKVVHEKNLQGKQLGGQLNDYDRKERIKDQMTDTANDFIKQTGLNIADGSHSIEEVKKILLETQQLNNSLQIGGNLNQSVNSLDKGKKLSNSIYETLSELRSENIGLKTQKKLIGSLFHMIGAELLGEDSTSYGKHFEQMDISNELFEFIKAKFTEIKNRIENNDIL